MVVTASFAKCVEGIQIKSERIGTQHIAMRVVIRMRGEMDLRSTETNNNVWNDSRNRRTRKVQTGGYEIIETSDRLKQSDAGESESGKRKREMQITEDNRGGRDCERVRSKRCES